MGNKQGYALAASLMVLALLSVLGAAAIQSSTIEVQISAHDRDARLALYVAESALGEARYYASRGWGKFSLQGGNQVVVDTPLPPGLRWDADKYPDFTLVDRLGASFPVLANTGSLTPPVLTLSLGTDVPAPGRFNLIRNIPAASWASPDLVVEDDPWAVRSPADYWQGWTLWNAAGDAFLVEASSSAVSTVSPPNQALHLTLNQDPGAGPYMLSLNPWAQALAAGAASLAGDADAGTAAWNRVLADPANVELGRGTVTAARESPGRYLFTCTGAVGNRQRQVSFRVYRAGRADQRVGDWMVL